jgi:capsular polysaccharide transport system permease protein
MPSSSTGKIFDNCPEARSGPGEGLRGPGAASLDKDWNSDKLHFDPEAVMEATPGTEPIRRPRASPLAINAAAIGAILLRDIRRRAGPYYTGFLMLLLMPLAHLLIVVMAFHIFGRLAPEGTDQVVYFGMSILPFVIYAYLSRQIVISLAENRPLLYFNRVKIFDILLARGILEATGSVIVFIIFVCILAVYSNDFSPRDWAGIVFAVAATIYFSFSIGVSNALIAHVLPVWHLLSNLSIPVFWLASGIVFFPTAIPDPYDRWLALNPLLQCVEWIRYSYYEDYPDRLLNIPYLITFATACLAISLIAERLTRHVLLSK